MRVRNARQLVKEHTDEIIAFIHRLESERVPCFRSTLVERLRSQCALTREQAERALELAISQRRVVELFNVTSRLDDAICYDLRSLKFAFWLQCFEPQFECL